VYVDDVAETKYKVMSWTRDGQRLILEQELISSKPSSEGWDHGPWFHVRMASHVGGLLFRVGTFLESILGSSFLNSGTHSSFASSKW
jgi:hypothetical protein